MFRPSAIRRQVLLCRELIKGHQRKANFNSKSKAFLNVNLPPRFRQFHASSHQLLSNTQSFPSLSLTEGSRPGSGTNQSDKSGSTTSENGVELGDVVGAKLFLSFTCTVCNGSNSFTFSKQAYTKGVVIVTCQSCQNNHLIADNLGWFEDAAGKNIEEILASKGEKVKRFYSKETKEIVTEE